MMSQKEENFSPDLLQSNNDRLHQAADRIDVSKSAKHLAHHLADVLGTDHAVSIKQIGKAFEIADSVAQALVDELIRAKFLVQQPRFFLRRSYIINDDLVKKPSPEQVRSTFRVISGGTAGIR